MRRRSDSYDEEEARREPLLGRQESNSQGGAAAAAAAGAASDDDDDGLRPLGERQGLAVHQGGEEGQDRLSRGPSRGLSPDRPLREASTPGGAIRLTKRASTLAQVWLRELWQRLLLPAAARFLLHVPPVCSRLLPQLLSRLPAPPLRGAGGRGGAAGAGAQRRARGGQQGRRRARGALLHGRAQGQGQGDSQLAMAGGSYPQPPASWLT